MKLSKMFSGKNKKMVNMLLILGLVVVAVVLYKYNFSKFSFRDSMQGKLSANSMVLSEASAPQGASTEGTESVEQSVQGTPSLQQKPFMNVSGMASPKPQASCNNQPLMDPKELLPQDSNSEWSEFAPQGQGDLLGSGSLLNPELSQRPYNSVQGANALRGDPQISIGDIPSIATPANPIQSNNAGIN